MPMRYFTHNSPSQVRNTLHQPDKLEEWSKRETQTIGGALIVDIQLDVVDEDEELFQYDIVEVRETESGEESGEGK